MLNFLIKKYALNLKTIKIFSSVRKFEHSLFDKLLMNQKWTIETFSEILISQNRDLGLNAYFETKENS